MTLKIWFENWIHQYNKKGIKKSTIKIYTGYMNNYIVPILGDIAVDNLSIQNIQDFYDKLIEEQKIGNKTLRNMHSVIHRCLKEAVRQRVITLNPSDYIELPRSEEKEMKILKEEEISKLLNVIRKEKLGISIYIGLYTGLRLGEILGLKWNNIDLDKGILKVTHSLGREDIERESCNKTKLVLHEPKTQNSKREVPLKNDLINELKSYFEQQKVRYEINDIEGDFVVSKKYMNPVDPKTIQEFFKRSLVKAGIGSYRFHELRHTFASKLIKSGVSDKVTSKLLGHSSVTTTLNIYTHISDDIGREAINKI